MSHQVSVQQAALLTGKSRETINKATQEGRLSFTRSARNTKVIDIAELERVFPLVRTPDDLAVSGTVRPGPALTAEPSGLREQVAVLAERLEGLQREQETLRVERDRERRQLEAEIEHLRTTLEKAQDQHGKAMLLLTHQNGEEGAGVSRENFKVLTERVQRLGRQNRLIYEELKARKAGPFWKQWLSLRSLT